ncbi:MAG: hypothetical protein HW421_2647 [Ignavibacteria bacterium]|nr:hypothetical protein [Ignavibacteria bacterium]
MSFEIVFLGGTREIGANSVYICAGGTGIIIDAGLHPEKRNRSAFPDFSIIAEKPTDLLILTHAHTDHIGAIPFALKYFSHLRLFMTYPTRDLIEIMLRDTSKLLKSEITSEFPADALSLYQPETLERINMLAESFDYGQKIEYRGRSGEKQVSITLFPAGHILGSASVLIEYEGKALLHTGDINFEEQYVLPGAAIPQHHLDCLITESTNAAGKLQKDMKKEEKRLTNYINKIVDGNGSILMPAFALGKTQEMLKLLYRLMYKCTIPNLPIYTGGLAKKISRVYDKYCYTVPMLEPGFEISDIPQEKIIYDELYTGKYFKESAILVLPSGMMNRGTLTHRLAYEWFRRKNFGIAIVGYQSPDSPGSVLLNSETGKIFEFGSRKVERRCSLERFRFSSHASFNGIYNYILQTKPKELFIFHGSDESCDALAESVSDSRLPTKIHVAEQGREYRI